MVEAALLSFLAPSARPLAPQVTALPPLAAYHDLRWLFAFNQPWLGFTPVLVLLVVARSAADAVLILLGTAAALSQGGVGQAWWRRLPPARTAAWVITTFGVLSLTSALMTHLGTPGIIAVAGLAGIV